MPDGEIVITRVFEAPIQLVWDAWTKPEHFSKWWGPKPFTAPTIEMDVRPGGSFLWSMQPPEGDEMFSAGVFREVDKPRRLVCDVWFSDRQGNKVSPATHGLPGDIIGDWNGEQTIEVTLEDLGQRTKMTMRQTGIPEGEMRKMAAAGWSTSLDKLHEALVEGRAMVLGRVYDAPRELVWEAFSKPEHLDKWWGPNGFTTKTKEHDFREGGVWRHTMVASDGTEFPNRTEYLEIVEPERMVYRIGDDDNHEMFRSTVTFMEFMGQTHVNMIAVFPTPEDRDRTVEEANAIEGGKQTLERLAEHLKTLA